MAEVINDRAQQLAELAGRFVNSGGTFKALQGMDDTSMEAIYGVAHRLYENGKHEDAREVFRFLAFMDHFQARYFLGLGCCEQMLGSHAAAIESLDYASLLNDGQEPAPILHAAECRLALGRLEEALAGFHEARRLAATRTEWAVLEERAGRLLEILVPAQPDAGDPA